MATVYNTKLSSISLIAQPDSTGGLTYSVAGKSFTATGGSVTSVGSTSLGVAAAHTYNGYIVECTDAGNAVNIGLRRRVITCDTNVMYTEKWPATVQSGDTFALLEPPHVYCQIDAATTKESKEISTQRDEADNTYNGNAMMGGPYAQAVYMQNTAIATYGLENILVATSYATGGINLTASPAVSNLQGDHWEIWKTLEVLDGMIECTREPVERAPVLGAFGTLKDAAGLRRATGSLTFAFRGPGTGRETEIAELHEVLKCVYSVNDAADMTADAGGSTSSIEISSGTAEVGAMYLTESGDAFMCLDSSEPYTPTPTLSVALGTGDTVYGGTTYTPASSLQYALSAKQYRGNGIMEYIWGLAPQPVFSGADNDFLKCTVNLQGCDWYRSQYGWDGAAAAHERLWEPKLPSVDPIICRDMRVVIGTTTFPLKSFTFDPGLDIQHSVSLGNPNNTAGYRLVNHNPTGTIEVYVDSTTIAALDDFLACRAQNMLIQCGTVPGFPGCLAIWGYDAIYTGPQITDDAGQLSLTLPFKFVRRAVYTSSSYPQYAIYIA